MRSTCARLLLSIAAAAALLVGSAAQATYVGPTLYTGVPGSPWDGLGLTLEDFEDGALNTPGVSASAGGTLAPGALVDSVDPGGWSYYTYGATSITFTFTGLPTHAGIVWTDVGYLLNESFPGPYTGIDDVFFEGFDEFGASMGVIGPYLLGDGSAAPLPGEDHFFGVTNPGGITKIVISMGFSNDWEMDHLQFGTPILVPEPGTAALLLFGLASLALRRRR